MASVWTIENLIYINEKLRNQGTGQQEIPWKQQDFLSQVTIF